MSHRTRQALCAVLGLTLPLAVFAADDFDAPPIGYRSTKADNPVSRLQDAIANNSEALEYDPRFGYLPSVIDRLKIPRESQVLVFTKTSLQAQYIAPSNPRSIYFNDDTYVGGVPGGELLEVSAADPDLGAVFYTVAQRKSDRPQFVRQHDTCLQCHGSVLTSGIPGHVVRSVYPGADGFPILKAGSFVTTQASPWNERWGGWYVTGNHGRARHMGNAIATETELDAAIDMEAGANRMTLDQRVDRDKYLTGHSDIVALLVLEHQTRMHNLITNANFETRVALDRQAAVDEILKRDPKVLSESTQHIIKSVGDKLVDYMLFADEMPLDSPVSGASGFTEVFSRQGPRDSQGRSLREFDLQDRLFKYPLSYLIYSPQFDGLPTQAKDYVYRRLWDILTGVVFAKDYVHLTKEKRQAIRQIVIETKPGLPAYWKKD
jgi:hypothetical protein